MIKGDLYKKIIDLIPIVCVDIIIKYNDKYLLVKRSRNPLKGEWWVVGGRIHKSELADNACRRIMIEEISISVSNFNYVGVYQDFFDESSFGKHGYHTISLVFETEIDNLKDIKLDHQSSSWRLFDQLPVRFKIMK